MHDARTRLAGATLLALATVAVPQGSARAEAVLQASITRGQPFSKNHFTHCSVYS